MHLISLACRVLPAILNASLTASANLAFMQILYEYSSSISPFLSAFPECMSLRDVIVGLAQSYAKEEIVYESHFNASRAIIVCFKVGAVDPGVDIANRFLSRQDLTPKTITSTLMPLLKSLCQADVILKALDRLEHFVQVVFVAWADKVLGPRPETDCSAAVGALERWTCECWRCSEIRTFVRCGETESKNLWLDLDAKAFRHVTGCLKENMNGLGVTWRSVDSNRTSEELQVRCPSPCTSTTQRNRP